MRNLFAVLRKNKIVASRRKDELAKQLINPVVLLGVLILMRNLFEIKTYPEQLDYPKVPLSSRIPGLPGVIGLAPNVSPAGSDTQCHPALSSVATILRQLSVGAPTRVVCFPSEQALDEAARSSGMLAAVLFPNPAAIFAPPPTTATTTPATAEATVAFTLKMNATRMSGLALLGRDGGGAFHDPTRGPSGVPQRYLHSGFLPLQLAVQQALSVAAVSAQRARALSAAAAAANVSAAAVAAAAAGGGGVGGGGSNSSSAVASFVAALSAVRLRQFPTASFTSATAIEQLASIAPFYLVMVFGAQVQFLLTDMMEEKEKRVKEAMRMAGLSDGVYYLSWLLTGGLAGSIMSLVTLLLVKVGRVFAAADALLLLLLFLLFSLSIIAYCFVAASLFNKARTGVAGGYLGLLILGIPLFLFTQSDVAVGLKVALSLCCPTAFGMGIIIVLRAEHTAIGGLSWSNVGDPNLGSLGVSFGHCLLFLLLDIALYSFMGWYLDKVVPSEVGVRQPPWFCFMPSYWAERRVDNGRRVGNGGAENNIELLSRDPEGKNDNNISGNVTDATPAVSIRALVKEFKASDGSTKRAVDGLSLDLFEGEITCLLGHNGAGKSTTISLLTGLYSPTDGDAQVYGHSIAADMERLRPLMGVCPQHDVLLERLTAEENLQFFGRLRGLSAEAAAEQATQLLADLQLSEKADALSKTLSGGQKRKLSVGLALIGDPRVVFLDEPSSGMDPHARRELWALLERAKRGRVIVLTTHYMDEADFLGDRIAVMSHGRLQVCGTSLSLKSHYGLGYHLNLSLGSEQQQEQQQQVSVDPVMHLIRAHVPSATIDEPASSTIQWAQLATDVLVSVSEAPAMDAGAEEGKADAALPPPVDARGRGTVGAGGTLSVLLPLDAVSAFGALLRALEAGKAEVGVDGYGLSVTTLEEVFTALAAEEAAADNAAAAEEAKGGDKEGQGAGSGGADAADGGMDVAAAQELLKEIVKLPLTPTPGTQLRSLLRRRLIRARRSKVVVFFQCVFPLLFVVISTVFQSLQGIDKKTFVNTPLGLPFLVDPKAGGVTSIPFAMRAPAATATAGLNVTTAAPSGLLSPALASPPYSALFSPLTAGDVTSDTALASHLVTGRALAGALVFHPPSVPVLAANYTIWYNTSVTNSLPVLLATVGGAVLRSQMLAASQLPPATVAAIAAASASNSSNNSSSSSGAVAAVLAALQPQYPASSPPAFNVSYQPLPPGPGEEVGGIGSFLAQGLLGLYVAIGFAQIPAMQALKAVKEREIGITHQQLVNGVPMPLHWLGAWIFDSFLFVPTSLLTLLLLFVLSPVFRARLPAVLLLLLAYGLCLPPLVYALSRLWDSHLIANRRVSVIFSLCTMVLFMGSSTLRFPTLNVDKTLVTVVESVFMLFPQYALAAGMFDIGYLTSLPAGLAKPLYSWDVLWQKVCWLAVSALLGLALVLWGTHRDTMRKFVPWTEERDRACREAAAAAAAATATATAMQGAKGESGKLTAAKEGGGSGAAGETKAATEAAGAGGVDEEAGSASLPLLRTGESEGEWGGLQGESDADVDAERRRVLALLTPSGQHRLRGSGNDGNGNDGDGDGNGDNILLAHTRKEWKAGGRQATATVAVRDLCLGIRGGECFGLLGPNGAGKSSCFAVLTGAAAPTCGTAWLAGRDVCTDMAAAFPLLGVCPQQNALFETLTPVETLTFYAEVCGYPAADVPRVVTCLTSLLGLTDHAATMAKNLSGGNQRKLSLAVALVGSPQLLLLDEPSAGLDPVARRAMRAAINGVRLATGCSVVLTSHLMAEVNSLCGRLAILVNGSLACLGTPQHLKNVYGQGYELEVETADPSALSRFVQQQWPSATVVDCHRGRFKFRLPLAMPLAEVFSLLEREKAALDVSSYAVSQTTLDQVFLRFARRQIESDTANTAAAAGSRP